MEKPISSCITGTPEALTLECSTASWLSCDTAFILAQERPIAFYRSQNLSSPEETLVGVFVEDFAEGGEEQLPDIQYTAGNSPKCTRCRKRIFV